MSRLRAAVERLNPALPLEAITAAVDELTRDRSAMSLEAANREVDLVSQFSATGVLYTCRPDLVGFVNGPPLIAIEFTKLGVPARAAFDENLMHYKQQVPALFWFNALLIASNGTDSRVGSQTTDRGRFFEWKRIEREDKPRRESQGVMLRGAGERARLHPLLRRWPKGCVSIGFC